MNRRRDRRGRGPRGPLLPPGLPGHRSRSERFGEHVEASLRRLSARWATELSRIDVAIEDVPPTDAVAATGVAGPTGVAGLGRAESGDAWRPARVVVHRRPVEALADGDLPDLVHEVVVHLVAELLGRAPEEVDTGPGS